MITQNDFDTAIQQIQNETGAPSEMCIATLRKKTGNGIFRGNDKDLATNVTDTIAEIKAKLS